MSIVAITSGAAVGVLALALLWRHQTRRNAVLRSRLAAAAGDLERLQDACSRLAPAGVVQRMLADGTVSALSVAESKVVTILFADLVGYTQLGERLEPERLARLINGYLQRMSDAIHANGGHVVQFLGDGVLACFGGLRPNPWQCDDSVRAALAMRSAVADYNIRHRDPSWPGVSGNAWIA